LFGHGVLENLIQGLSRTMSVFKDFPGLENLEKKFKDFQGPARALNNEGCDRQWKSTSVKWKFASFKSWVGAIVHYCIVVICVISFIFIRSAVSHILMWPSVKLINNEHIGMLKFLCRNLTPRAFRMKLIWFGTIWTELSQLWCDAVAMVTGSRSWSYNEAYFVFHR